MNYSFLLVLACVSDLLVAVLVMLVAAPFLLYGAARERRRRARERLAALTCYCDLATCPRSQVCRMLGEYRITYRVVEQIANEPEYSITTIAELLQHIRCECDILVK